MSIDFEKLLKPAWEPVEAGEMERGTPVRIYEANRGTREMMRRKADDVRRSVTRFIAREYPLECWRVHLRKPTHPWGGWEVWAEFHGALGRVQEVGRWKAARRRESRGKRAAAE